MKTLTQFVALPVAALGLALPFSAPAVAGEKSDGIVVTSMAKMKEWQAETTKDINRSLRSAPIPNSSRPNKAVVQIAFTLGADGKPDNIEVLDGRGNWAARRAASYAVRRLNDLDQVPVTNPADAQFLANIFFAGTAEDYKELKAQLKKSEARRLAAADGEEEYILLGG
ncbi:MAG: hypothetical protein QNJ15_08995 [Erythrobacter sp.]|nr:hypothetical protein [Erythrobacter sp.]